MKKCRATKEAVREVELDHGGTCPLCDRPASEHESEKPQTDKKLDWNEMMEAANKGIEYPGPVNANELARFVKKRELNARLEELERLKERNAKWRSVGADKWKSIEVLREYYERRINELKGEL